jgi:hypothetical protein
VTGKALKIVTILNYLPLRKAVSFYADLKTETTNRQNAEPVLRLCLCVVLLAYQVLCHTNERIIHIKTFIQGSYWLREVL